MSRPALFLDRDGVVIRNSHYLDDPARIELLPGAAEAIRTANAAELAVVIVSNQSGVARGYFSEDRLREIHRRLKGALAQYGARVDAIYYCPHHPDYGPPAYRRTCTCRKPSPGMLLEAARDLDLDLSASALVGDEGRDILAGRRAGVACAVLIAAPGRHPTLSPDERPDFFASALDIAFSRLLDVLT